MSKPEVAKHVTPSFFVLNLVLFTTETRQRYTVSRIRRLDHYSMNLTTNCGPNMSMQSVKLLSLRAM